MNWQQVPAAPPAAARSGGWLAWPLATVPLLLAIASFTDPRGWWLGWALPVGAVNLALLLVGRWNRLAFLPAALVGALGLAGWLGGADGQLVAGFAVVGTVIWGWGLGLVPVPVRRLEPRSMLRPAMIAAALCDLCLLVVPKLRFAAWAMVLAGILAVAAAVAPAIARRVGDGLEPAARRVRAGARRVDDLLLRVAHLIGRVVSSIVMVPVVVVATVIWAIQRLVRHDPLAPPTPRTTSWTDRLGADPYPVRSYSGAGLADRRTTAARVSSALVVVVALALVAGAAVAFVRWDDEQAPSSPEAAAAITTTTAAGSTPSSSCGTPEPDPVLSAQPGYATLSCERTDAFSHAEYLGSTGYRLQDHKGKVVNITDGKRKTWKPPACSCPRLTVWWFGGSAAWGEGQRDLYSLPSMLAREAWKHGVALDIVNYAMPTYTFNQEVHLLADLTTTEDPPDLILSYSGGNDLVFQALRASRGDGDDSSDIALLEQTFDDVLRNGIPVDHDRIEWTPNPQEVDADLSQEMIDQVSKSTSDRYRRNLGLAERLADSIDRPIGFIWQPLLAGSAAGAGPEGVVPPGLLKGFTSMEQQVRGDLPSQVIDMGDAYADVDEPVFFDLFHTGEAGAAMMADQLYPELEPLIAQAQRDAEDRSPN